MVQLYRYGARARSRLTDSCCTQLGLYSSASIALLRCFPSFSTSTSLLLQLDGLLFGVFFHQHAPMEPIINLHFQLNYFGPLVLHLKFM